MDFIGGWGVDGSAGPGVEVHDIGNHAMAHSVLEFIDRNGSAHALPGPDTVNARRKAKTTRTLDTFVSDRPTPGRVSGVFIAGNGRACLLGGKTNNNERAFVWMMQRK